MFPNDDICNVRAAKSAARRIFQKYAYDPSMSDVSSFMSVFGVGQNGTIELDKLEELAVKYLCGEQALKGQSNNPELKQKTVKTEIKVQSEVPVISSYKKFQNDQKVNLENPLEFKNTGNRPSIQILPSNSKTLGLKFLSPKAPQTNNFFSSKENSLNSPKNSIKEEIKTFKKPSYSEVLNRANQIFNQCKNKQKMGITINQASEVMTRTYRLIGKNKFTPSEEDVKIWMKLCDVKKNGIVEWISYENFVRRMMERQNICEMNEK